LSPIGAEEGDDAIDSPCSRDFSEPQENKTKVNKAMHKIGRIFFINEAIE
jgi:hypothetical protein